MIGLRTLLPENTLKEDDADLQMVPPLCHLRRAFTLAGWVLPGGHAEGEYFWMGTDRREEPQRVVTREVGRKTGEETSEKPSKKCARGRRRKDGGEEEPERGSR
jgi:hypothetical protein